MTFEEWLDIVTDRSKLTNLYSTVEEIEDGLRKAWQAGYDEGYEDGVEEVMSK